METGEEMIKRGGAVLCTAYGIRYVMFWKKGTLLSIVLGEGDEVTASKKHTVSTFGKRR